MKTVRSIFRQVSLASRLCAVLFLSACCMLCNAQTKRQIRDSKKNFISLNVSGGYASLLNDEPVLKNNGMAGAALGVGYRFYYNHFIFGAGLEGRYSLYGVAPVDDRMTFSMIDSEGDPFTMNAVISDRRDVMHAVDLQIPLQIGGEWGHWYAMVGAKLAFNLYGTARTTANVTTTATYDRFADDFQDMPNHYLYNGQDILSDRQGVSFNPQVYGTVEFGYRLGKLYTGTGADIPKSKTRYYIGVFAELGFLNLHKENAQGAPVVSSINPEGGMTFSINPVYNTTTYKDAVVRNYMAGVKFTVLFELPKQLKCVICDERDRRNRRGF